MTSPIYCDHCQSTVRVERDDNGTLQAVCACGIKRSLRVASGLPEGWK